MPSEVTQLPGCAVIQELYDANRFVDAYEQTASAWSDRSSVESLGLDEVILAARLAFRLGSGKYGRGLFRLARSLAPGDPTVRYYTRNAVERRRSLYDQLLRHEEEPTLGSDRDDIEAYWCADHAVLLGYVRDFDRALERIADGNRLVPDDPWIGACHAQVLLQMDRWEEALEVAERVWSGCPGLPFGACVLGSALAALGRQDEAARRFLAFCDEMPQSHEVFEVGFNHAIDSIESGRDDLADILPEGLYERGRRLDQLAPIADRRHRIAFARQRAEAAKLEGRREELELEARRARTPYYWRVAENLAAATDGKRVVIPHEKFRQQHNTCLPASVVSCASAFDVKIDHDELVQRMTHGGTPKWRVAEWAAANGWICRPFVGDRETCIALLERGVPFVFTLRSLTHSHAVAAIGYDSGMGTFLYHDPSSSRVGEMILDGIADGEAPLGPDCMLLLPESESGRLEGLELHGEAFATATMTIGRAHEHGDREAAVSAAAEYGASQKDGAGAGYLRARVAYESGRPGEAVQVLRSLITEHPECLWLQVLTLQASEATGNVAAYREVLKSIATRAPLPGIDDSKEWIQPEPIMLARYSDMLMQSAQHLAEARHFLERALYRGPVFGEIYHYMADLLMKESARDPSRLDQALLAFRFASTLEAENEHYASAYAWALRKKGRSEEGIAWLRGRVEKLTGDTGGGFPWITLIETEESLGFPEASLDDLRRGLEERPRDAQLHGFAVSFLARYGRFEEARRALEVCREHGPKTLFEKSATHLAQAEGQRAQALEHARAWLDARPLDRDARQTVFDLVSSVEGLESANELLESWKARLPEDDDLEYLELEHMRRTDRAEGRLAVLESRVERNPFDVWAWRELAWEYLAQIERLSGDEFEAALVRYRELVGECERVCPDAPSTLGLQAELAMHEDRTDDAIDLLGRALVEDPEYVYAINRIFSIVRPRPVEERRAVIAVIDRAFSAETHQLVAARPAALRIAQVVGRDDAIAAVERWGELSPDDPHVAEAWVDVHLEEGVGVESAEKILPRLERMVEKFPLNRGLAFSLADAYKMLTRFDDAIGCFERIVEVNPCWSFARVALAETYEYLGRDDEALAEIRRATDIEPRDHNLWLRLVDFLAVREQREEAIDVLEKATSHSPRTMNLWERRIELLESVGRPGEAIAVAKELVGRFPDGAYTHLVLARAYRASSQIVAREEIEKELRTSIERNARLWEATWEYALFLCDHADYEKARSVVEAHLRLEKDDVAALGALPYIEWRSGEREAGLQSMRELVNARPDYEYGWRCLLDWVESLEAWDTARELFADPPAMLLEDSYLAFKRLQVLRQAGMSFEELETDWRRLTGNFPTEAVLNLAFVDELLGVEKIDEAAEALESFARYEPDSPRVNSRRVAVAAERKDGEKAIEHARSVIGFRGGDMPNSAMVTLQALAKLGQIDAAGEIVLELLRRGERVMPSALDGLVSHYQEAKKRDGFRALLEQLEQGHFEWNHVEYIAIVLETWVEADGAKAIIKWSRLNEDLCRSDTRLWQAVGRAYAIEERTKDVHRWMKSWRDHEAIEQWALSNYAHACLETDRFQDCIDASIYSLESCELDHSAPDMVGYALNASLQLDNEAGFIEYYTRFRHILVRGREHLELLYGSIARVIDGAPPRQIKELHAHSRPARAGKAWATRLWKKTIRRRLGVLARAMLAVGLWGR